MTLRDWFVIGAVIGGGIVFLATIAWLDMQGGEHEVDSKAKDGWAL